MTGKPNNKQRTVTLTPRGQWQAARLKLLARLGDKCKAAK